MLTEQTHSDEDRPTKTRQSDPFCDSFRDQLENYQLPVDNQCWESINARIHPAKPAKQKLFWTKCWTHTYQVLRYAGIIMVLLMIVPVTDPVRKTQFVLEKKTLKKNAPYTIKHDLIVQEQMRNRSNVTPPKVRGVLKEKAVHVKDEKLVEIRVDLQNMEEDVFDTAGLATTSKQEPEVQKETSNKSNTPQAIYNDKKYNMEEVFIVKKKVNEKWKLATSFRMAESANSLPTPTYQYASVQISDPATISDATHASPFSIGLLVQRKLNNTFSIETGLTYSYLSTTYRDIGRDIYYAKQKLHYIGIPVSVVANIWAITPHWNVYAGAGARLEKGILSDFEQYDHEDKQTKSARGDISGVQWSVNTSVGLSYKIHKGWSLYVEPNVSYYFDNKQPISIRTDKQTILEFKAGFRYTL